MSGIATITIHAPSVNFVATTMTIDDERSPWRRSPLTTARHLQPGPCVRSQ